MSEEKIIDHTEKAIRAIFNKERKWYEKLKDFLMEIVIIIIAVSLTLWFHNLNARAHDRKLEKDFLIGEREDLKADTSELLGYCLRDYQHTMDYYDTAFLQIMDNRIDTDYIDNNSENLENTAYFDYNNARFESFRSSGNLKLIENKKLLNDITYLYTVVLPDQKENDRLMFNKREEYYDEYIGSKLKFYRFGKSPDQFYQNFISLIHETSFQYLLAKYILLFRERKRMILRESKTITKVIKEINKELRDRFDYIPSDSKN